MSNNQHDSILESRLLIIEQKLDFVVRVIESATECECDFIALKKALRESVTKIVALKADSRALCKESSDSDAEVLLETAR